MLFPLPNRDMKLICGKQRIKVGSVSIFNKFVYGVKVSEQNFGWIFSEVIFTYLFIQYYFNQGSLSS